MSERTVGDLMTSEVATLDRNDELGLAEQIMSLGRIRHLPVVDDGEVVGIVSQRDLFRSALVKALGHGSVAEDRLLRVIRVKEVMQSKLQTAAPGEPLREAAARMARDKVGCLPVVDDGALVGILTEGDFVRAFAEGSE